MIKVNVIAMGKLKEKYLSEAVKEYSKRLSRYADFTVLELEPVKLSDKPSQAEITSALQKESELIFKKIPQSSFVCALCVEGKPLSSEDLALKVKELSGVGKNITFIIGSSYGLSENVKKSADLRLSISAMTFPHQLFRVMLLEQIYRAFKINEGSTYHK